MLALHATSVVYYTYVRILLVQAVHTERALSRTCVLLLSLGMLVATIVGEGLNLVHIDISTMILQLFKVVQFYKCTCV